MDNCNFCYVLSEDTWVFTDSIRAGCPYSAESPRNHESLFLVTDGALLYERKGIKEVVQKGQIGYIARGSIDKSSAYLCNEVSYIAINFRFDKTGINTEKTLPFEVLCSKGNVYKYEQLFRDLLDNYLIKTPGYMTVCNGILMQIIGLLYNEHKTDVSWFQKAGKIEDAIQYLNDNYGSCDLQISELADIVNMSEKNFRRIFRDVYKKTPYTFLQEFRINKAEILLQHTSKSISDIALQCGFSDVYGFSHCFKKHAGTSPTEYRSKNRS